MPFHQPSTLSMWRYRSLTLFVVSSEVFLADEEIVIFVQLPEFTVDDIEVFVGEVVRDLVYVLFFFQCVYCLD